MKTSLFVNFTDQEFIGYWDGKGRKYPSGASEYMPDYLAKHFAKHLVNRELLRTKSDGTLVYKDGDKMTSPKFPEQVPMFMELFNKACISDDANDTGSIDDSLDAVIKAANKNREKESKEQSEHKPENKPEKSDAKPTKQATQPKPENTKPLSKPRQPKPQEDENFKRETSGAGASGVQEIISPDWDEDK